LSVLPDLAIFELVERFLEHAKVYYRNPDGTPGREVENYKTPLGLLVRLYGPTPAAEFGPLALEAIRVTMIKSGQCRTFTNRQIDRLKGVFKWATSKELIPSSVYEALRSLAGLRVGHTEARESEPVKPVPDSDVESTLPHLSVTVRAMVQVQRLTGARPGEICGMRIGDVDRGGAVWVYRPERHKTQHHGHHREIFIGPKAQTILAPFMLKLDPGANVFSPAAAMEEMRQRRHEARKTPMSCGNVPGSNRKRKPKRQPRQRYDVNAYRHAIVRACELAKVEAWHPHQLRHTSATDVRRQFGIEAAQHHLGHATTTMTEIYAERNSETARAVASAIG